MKLEGCVIVIELAEVFDLTLSALVHTNFRKWYFSNYG